MTPIKSTQKQAGFALLLTIVIITVLLAVGLSLLDITVKQISLSVTGRDSELAFHAAQASLECAQRTVIEEDYLSSFPASMQASCFANNETSSRSSDLASVSDVETYMYSYEFDWDSPEQPVCSQFDVYFIDTRGRSTDYVQQFIDQGLVEETCEADSVCTVIFARGFNRACTEIGSLRTVQRELTVTF